MITDEKIIYRFLEKIEFPATTDGCWLWTACRNQNGYGSFRYKETIHKAHRISWMIFRDEPLEEGLELDHLCHCRHCVNPAHLRQVNRKENMANLSEVGKEAKREGGKKNRGENNGGAKLTAANVVDIKKHLAQGRLTQKQIARLFSINNSHVSDIKTGRSWAWLTPPAQQEEASTEPTPKP